MKILGTIALVSDGDRAHFIIDFIYYEIYAPCETTMTVIATNFLNLLFANEIMDAFKEYPTFRINTPIHNIFCSPAQVALGPSPESRSALSAG